MLRSLACGLSAGLAVVVLVPCAARGQVALHALHVGISTAGDEFGISARNSADVNADGYADIVVGSRLHAVQGVSDVGAVTAFSGRTGVVLWQREGAPDDGEFGRRVDFIGDISGDGVQDVIVGSPAAMLDVNQMNPKGRFYVLSGATGDVLNVEDGSAQGEWLGFDVSRAGFIDGDAVPDYVVGSHFGDTPTGTPAGFARAYSGATHLPIFTLYGTLAGDDYGTALAGLPDLNGDGRNELLVGCHQGHVSPQLSQSGFVQVISGLDNTVLETFFGDKLGDTFGRSVADAGDVDGDGVHDIIIGANEEQTGKVGYAHVYSGATWARIGTIVGDAPGDEFGWNVAGAGDYDCDGFDDVLVSAGGYDAPDSGAGTLVNAGVARVYTVPSGGVLFERAGSAAGDCVQTVAGGGDVNRDGLPDIVIGAPCDDVNGSDSGSALVYCGLPAFCTNTPASLDADGDGVPDDCDPFVDVGFALGGASCAAPHLDGTGFLLPGKLVRLSLTGAPGASVAYIVLGFTAVFSPFKGGTLVPNKDIFLGLPVGPGGELIIETTWPPGVPPGVMFWVQVWFANACGPVGFISTNGVQATAP